MKRLIFFFAMAVCAIGSLYAQEQFKSHIVADEGAWCWFADPRALHYENESKTINATYESKGIRLDVYVEDDQNTVFDYLGVG